MSYLTILRSYAQKSDPTKLPSSVLFSHTDRFLTIFDAYPKATFHFLVLPRISGFDSPSVGHSAVNEDIGGATGSNEREEGPSTTAANTKKASLTVSDMANLRSLLKHTRAREVLTALDEEVRGLRVKIEEEMMERYGFKWEIWMGFHAIPSMEHVHLHVISSDLCSPSLKNKKHYNSFHPKEGFFLPLDQVLEWLDAEPSYFSSMAKLPHSQYEPILKRPLACWRCGDEMKNMPTLKDHLQAEWRKQGEREKVTAKSTRSRANAESKKRKRDMDATDPPGEISNAQRRKGDQTDEGRRDDKEPDA